MNQKNPRFEIPPHRRRAVPEQSPSLQGMYGADDGIFEVLYVMDANVALCSFKSDINLQGNCGSIF